MTVFCGHYGSGKSSLAVNYSLYLKSLCDSVTMADVDIVNPYFRSADSRKELEENGVGVITLPYANTNVDLPSLPSSIYGLVERADTHAVLDVGGDDRGAYALGRFTDSILRENDFEMLCVVNFARPLTSTPEDALEVMREINAVCALPFTGIVNNTNLGSQTTKELVLGSEEKAAELARLSGVPVAFTSAAKGVFPDGERPDIFRLTLHKYYF
ncbi:MAG: hypothetical protein K6C36_08040 [Clostridia bacterium]|nr:hypothetical protein [Clostridia bacterium]